MSFGLARGRELDPTGVGVTVEELPPLPDSVVTDPSSATVDPRRWFPEPERPFEIEIGCGKGTFLLQQGEAEEGRRRTGGRGANILGIEWAREFALYTADRVRRRGLPNIRVLNADATEFLHWRVPTGIVEVVHLYFPDPWPKKRHHRRRTVQDRFMEDCRRVLTARGELRVVTDHDGYWEWMEEVFNRWTDGAGRELVGEDKNGRPGGFERVEFDRPESALEGEVVGTNFERKYRREGRPFHAAVLRKRG